VLLDVLRAVRATLPAGRELSMTALASWCDTERWLGTAPVDEVVPMLFRMGPVGENPKRRLAEGGDSCQRCELRATLSFLGQYVPRTGSSEPGPT
jgi:hypothetical protein